MSESDYKETQMAELSMSEFVYVNIRLERILDNGRMKFRVNANPERGGCRIDTDHDTELAAKQDFLTRVREALALPEGTY
ncbi:hypothetical protein [Pseudomonas serbica]|uniref:hypothetical protein n=1 Tax=Pseudomonas serbica TaxID=2965074 RepID=UPI00237BC9C0|nr:hypothetical protein [Pseudomonas serbica]